MSSWLPMSPGLRPEGGVGVFSWLKAAAALLPTVIRFLPEIGLLGQDFDLTREGAH